MAELIFTVAVSVVDCVFFVSGILLVVVDDLVVVTNSVGAIPVNNQTKS